MPPLEVLLQQAFNGLMLGVTYALIAVGLTLFFGVPDVIHFSHGHVFLLGAFAGLSLTFLGALLLTGLLGVLAERACVKPLAKAPPLMTLLPTLFLGLVIREAVLIFYPRGADPKPFPALLPSGGFDVAGVTIRYENLAILAVGGAAMVLVDRVIDRTRLGASMRAADFTLFLGSALAAVAGILQGLYDSEIHFIMGIMGGVIGFSAAAIGRLGNVYGAILGRLLFDVLQTMAAAFIPRGSEFRDVVAFAVVMVFMVFRPTGILGEKTVGRA